MNPEPAVGLISNRRNINFNVFSWSINDQTDLCSGQIDNIRLFDIWLSQEARFSRDPKLLLVNENLDLNGCLLHLFWLDFPPYSMVISSGNHDGTVVKFLDVVSDLLNVSFRTTQDIKNAHIGFPCYYTENSIWLRTYPHIFEKHTWFVTSGSQIPDSYTHFLANETRGKRACSRLLDKKNE